MLDRFRHAQHATLAKTTPTEQGATSKRLKKHEQHRQRKGNEERTGNKLVRFLFGQCTVEAVAVVKNEPKRTNELGERRAVRICKDFHRKNLDAHLKVCNNTVMQTNKTVCIR